MFGSYLGRAVRSAPSTALPTRPTANPSSLGVAASSAAAAVVTAGVGVVRPLTSTRACGGQKHQRCHSSSKTSSCPPEVPKSDTSTEQAGTTATTTTTASTAAATAAGAGARPSSSASKKGIGRSNGNGEKRPAGRSGGRKKPRDAQQQVVIKGGRDTSASSLPIVPSTQHVEPTRMFFLVIQTCCFYSCISGHYTNRLLTTYMQTSPCPPFSLSIDPSHSPLRSRTLRPKRLSTPFLILGIRTPAASHQMSSPHFHKQ